MKKVQENRNELWTIASKKNTERSTQKKKKRVKLENKGKREIQKMR